MNDTAAQPDTLQPADPPSVKEVAKQFIKEFKDDEVTELAAAFAYHVIFAIPALVILTVQVAAMIENFANVDLASELTRLVNEQAPTAIQDVLTTVIDNAIAQASGGAITVGAIISAVVALWSGSNAVSAMMRAFNRAYDIDVDRSFIKKKLVALALTLFLGIFINLAVALIVFGGQIGEWIADWVGLGSAFETVWNIARWPVGAILVALMLAVLYHFGPNVENTFKWVSPGAIFTTITWIIAAIGFSIYLQYADPGSVYGSLGGLLVFLLFLYITGIVFISGAEINAIIEKRTEPDVLRDVMSKQKPEFERDWIAALREQQQSARQSAPAGQHAYASTERSPAGQEADPGFARLAVGALTTVGILTLGLLRRGGR